MKKPMSLQQKLKPALTVKQTQRMMMSPHMQQALSLLQLPVMELSGLVEEAMESNPVLEYIQEEPSGEAVDAPENPDQEVKIDDQDFEVLKKLDEDYADLFSQTRNPYIQRSSEDSDHQSYLENTLTWKSSLFEYLMEQAEETFESKKQLDMAEQIIGSLDESGYLTTPLEEIAALHQFSLQSLETILNEIQSFEPVGVGARNLSESLLIQLRFLGKEDTLAYRMIRDHFDDLLHNRLPVIAKSLKCSPEQIKEAVDHHIALLDLHPGTQQSRDVLQAIVPDAYIHLEDNQLNVEVNEGEMRPIRLNRKYMKMLQDPALTSETREYILNKVMSAKWLMRTLNHRNETLYRIVKALAEKQKNYFLHPKGKLEPLTMKAIAEELELHESTVARCVADKYLQCPRGLLPLRFFFSTAYETDSGVQLSSKTVQEELVRLIESEDKKKPLTDALLSKLLKRKGINCARRTVAKFRAQLNIANTHQRKKWD